MNLLDTVSRLFGGESSSRPVEAILQLLANHEGGTSGLMDSFQSNGLGGILSSWLGSGENQPISAYQVNRVFGSERVAALAEKLGVSPDQAAAKTAEYLPQIVDRLSPDGSLPVGSDLMAKARDLLKFVRAKTA